MGTGVVRVSYDILAVAQAWHTPLVTCLSSFIAHRVSCTFMGVCSVCSMREVYHYLIHPLLACDLVPVGRGAFILLNARLH